MKKRITAKADDKEIDEIINNAPKESLQFIDRSTEIAEQIFRMLDQRNWKQKDLAMKMGKSEAEISKILSGVHNLTLRTIAHLETIFEENIILTRAGLELNAQQEGHGFLIISAISNFNKPNSRRDLSIPAIGSNGNYESIKYNIENQEQTAA